MAKVKTSEQIQADRAKITAQLWQLVADAGRSGASALAKAATDAVRALEGSTQTQG